MVWNTIHFKAVITCTFHTVQCGIYWIRKNWVSTQYSVLLHCMTSHTINQVSQLISHYMWKRLVTKLTSHCRCIRPSKKKKLSNGLKTLFEKSGRRHFFPSIFYTALYLIMWFTSEKFAGFFKLVHVHVVSWPSGLAYRTQVLVLAAECGFKSRPWHLCPWARHLIIIASLHPGVKWVPVRAELVD